MKPINQSKILIIGAGGQLGTELRNIYPDAKHADYKELDITNTESVSGYDWSGVDTIINAAAFTNVDGAETPEGRRAAWAVNATAVSNLAKICLLHGITLVHVSSDYVFDGTVAPHAEDEPFTPLSVYGASKAAGDLVASTLPRHYILRTTWVIGEGPNFVRTMLGLGSKGISPTVVSDQIGRLTFTTELARAIDHLLQSNTPHGTYNVTNGGPVMNWADITRKIFELAGFDNLTVTNTTTAEYFASKDNIAPRPLLSEMSLDKLHSTEFNSRNWEDDLKEYIKKENNKE